MGEQHLHVLLTLQRVEGVTSQAEGTVADVTAEALAVEEVAVGAQPLHHVHPFAAEVADIAAAEPGREVLPHHTLKGGGRPG